MLACFFFYNILSIYIIFSPSQDISFLVFSSRAVDDYEMISG
jgi:hypothetical protein